MKPAATLVNQFPPSVRRRGLIALLIITFLMYGGFFMVIPLVSIYYVDSLGMAGMIVGLALATRQLLQQGAAVFGGMLGDRFGVKRLISLGVLIRAIGFISLAWAANIPLLFLAMVLSALGGAFFEAPRSAAIAALTTEEERARFYSIAGVVSGLAMTIGPLIGALLLRLNFSIICLVAAGCFIIIYFVAIWMLPPVRVATAQQGLSFGVQLALHDRPFMLFTALLMGFWFMWVQLTLSLPLEARALTGSNDSVSIVYSLNAGMTVLFQYPLMRFLEGRVRPLMLVIIGMAVMALGLGAVALVTSFPLLLACVALFSFGMLLATPTQQTVAAELADPRALGSYFGVNALALAFGGSIGHFSGGLLTDLARQMSLPMLPWITICSVGLISAGGMFILDHVLRRTHVSQPDPLPQ